MAQHVTAGNDRLACLEGNTLVYVIPQYKILFVSVAKNACTTMKWAMAELAGEDLDSFRPGIRPYTADEHGVHIRQLFKKALRVDQLDPNVRAEIDPGNGWFIFSIVRDPRVRLFSAWQDKLLLQDPGYRHFGGEPWYPRIPADADEVVADFARFVHAFASDREMQLSADRHFAGQTEQLLLEHVPYSRIYPTAQMTELQSDLLEHVQRLGWSGPLTFRRTNETPLNANAAVFAGGVREQIEERYAPDFEAFGRLWDFARIERAPAWSPAAIREVQVRGALGRRLDDMRQIALRHRARYEKAKARADRLKAELDDARSALRGENSTAGGRTSSGLLRRLTQRPGGS